MSIPLQAGPDGGRKLLALLYHELRPEAAAYSYVLPCVRFLEHLQVVTSLPRTAYQAVITFDDGHISNYVHALPMLERFEARAHFFITAGWVGERSEYMESRHLRALHEAGHTIGAHGWTHTLLTQCTGAQLRHELHDTRAALEEHIGAPVTSISLPGGRSNAAVMQACRDAGYATVWTSVPGEAVSIAQPTVGRFNMLAGHSGEFLRRLLDPASGELARAARKSRWKAAAQRAMGDRMYAQLWALLNGKEGLADEPAAQGPAHDRSRGAAS